MARDHAILTTLAIATKCNHGPLWKELFQTRSSTKSIYRIEGSSAISFIITFNAVSPISLVLFLTMRRIRSVAIVGALAKVMRVGHHLVLLRIVTHGEVAALCIGNVYLQRIGMTNKAFCTPGLRLHLC